MSRSGPLTPTQTAAHLLSAMEAGERAAILVVVSHPDPTRVGGRLLLRGDECLGSFLDPATDAAAVALAREGLSGSSKVLPGLHTLPLASGG